MTDKWVTCPNCGHKFFKVIEAGGNLTAVEIKCHSCKWVGIVPIRKTPEGDKHKYKGDRVEAI